jgi:hypothetical protein
LRAVGLNEEAARLDLRRRRSIAKSMLHWGPANDILPGSAEVARTPS